MSMLCMFNGNRCSYRVFKAFHLPLSRPSFAFDKRIGMVLGHPGQAQSKVFGFASFHYLIRRNLNIVWWAYIFFVLTGYQNFLQLRDYFRFSWTYNVIILHLVGHNIFVSELNCINQILGSDFQNVRIFRIACAMVFYLSFYYLACWFGWVTSEAAVKSWVRRHLRIRFRRNK